MRTAVVVPTYNERDNLQELVTELLALPIEDFHIIVVDDNSPDGTGQLADELGHVYPGVHAMHRPAKLGLGTAYIAGFRRALGLGADRVITMDADFSHHPRYIPNLLHITRSYHVAIGSRYIDGGGTRYCDLPRRALSRGANSFARVVLGFTVRDCTAGFRCYRREVLESVDLGQIFSDGYSFLIEMLFKIQAQGFRVVESPIVFEDRRQGQSKISRGEIVKAAYTVLRLRWEKSFDAPFPLAVPRDGRVPWNM